MFSRHGLRRSCETALVWGWFLLITDERLMEVIIENLTVRSIMSRGSTGGALEPLVPHLLHLLGKKVIITRADNEVTLGNNILTLFTWLMNNDVTRNISYTLNIYSLIGSNVSWKHTLYPWTFLKIVGHFNPTSSNFVLIASKINLNLFEDKMAKFYN